MLISAAQNVPLAQFATSNLRRSRKFMMRLSFLMKTWRVSPQNKLGIEDNMSNIFTIIIMILMAVLGGFSSLYVLTALPVVIIYKIYRKLKYGCKITD